MSVQKLYIRPAKAYLYNNFDEDNGREWAKERQRKQQLRRWRVLRKSLRRRAYPASR